MYVRVAQSVEDVTADHRLFHLEGVAGSSPAVYFYFYNIFCFLSSFLVFLFILFNKFHYFYFNSFHLILWHFINMNSTI